MPRTKSTRERFRDLVAKEPTLIQAEIAARLGVTRQRIGAIAAAEGYTVDRGSAGAALVPPAAEAPAVSDPLLATAADLSARGYAVYVPITAARPCDLVAIDSAGRVEQIRVEKPKGPVRYDTPEHDRKMRRAMLLTDVGVEYSPALRRKGEK